MPNKDWKQVIKSMNKSGYGFENFYQFAIFAACEWKSDTFEQWLDSIGITRKGFFQAWKNAIGRTYREFLVDDIIRSASKGQKRTLPIPEEWHDIKELQKREMFKFKSKNRYSVDDLIEREGSPTGADDDTSGEWMDDE